MDDSKTIEDSSSCSNDVNEHDLNYERIRATTPLDNRGIKPTLCYLPRILGTEAKNELKVPSLPHVNTMVLQTSLPYIPVYSHLKTYDIKPFVRPPMPPALAGVLRWSLPRHDTIEVSNSYTSLPSSERTSNGRSCVSKKPMDSQIKNAK